MKQGWKTKKLFEVCDIVGGSTPKTNEPSYWNGEYYWVTPAELNNEKYISFTQRTITNIGVKSAHLQLLPTGTVLLSSRAPIGKLAITTVPMYCNQGFKNLVCGKEIYNEYAYYFLLKNKDYLNSLGTGATFKEISKRVVEQILIPFPSIEEQQRIVDILDKEFEKIDTLKANAEKGLQYAKDLFQSALKQELQPKEGWTTKTIGELSEDLFAGGDVPRESFSKNQNDDYNIPIYANAVENNGLYGYTNRARVIKPSITIAGRGSGTGYVIERNESYFPVVRLIVVIPNEFVLNKYLYYALKALNIKSNGSAIPQLTVPMIAQYKINFPKSLDEQNTIICLLDRISEYCKTLQANYEKTIALCDDMKQALLRKAFNGEF